jgi:hypothetical protein
MRLLSSGLAGEESPFELLAVKITADEDDAAFPLLVLLPGPLVVTLDDHMDTLDHIAIIVAIKCDDPLEPQDVGAFELCDLLDPGKELLRIDGTGAQRNRLNGEIVDGRRGGMTVTVS